MVRRRTFRSTSLTAAKPWNSRVSFCVSMMTSIEPVIPANRIPSHLPDRPHPRRRAAPPERRTTSTRSAAATYFIQTM